MGGPPRDVRLALLAFAATTFLACGGSDRATEASPDRAPDSTAPPPDASTYFPGATWRTATPEQVGIPGSVLARVDQRVASRSTAPVTAAASQFGGVSVDYGLLWSMAPIDPARSTADVSNRAIIASGNMNQFLFVVPSRDLVVVNTGSSNDSFGVTVDFVVRELVPAVSR
jgi:CubicO group peptidase (beta-lactamase class C family)